MPAKRGKRTKPVKPPEVPEALELEEGRELEAEAGPGSVDLDDDVLGELDDESRYVVSIFRRVESGMRTGKLEYVARISPAEFTLDSVRERFGGGTYEFRVLRKDERGRERYHRTRTVHVAGAPRAIVTDGGPPSGAPVAVVGAPQSETERRVLEELERSRRARAALRRKLEALESRRNQASPVQWITALAPIVLPFLKASRGGTEEFVRALELGVKLGNRGGEDSPLGPIVDKALGVVEGIVSHGRQNGNGSSQTAPGILPAGQAAPGSAIAANGAGTVAQAKLAPIWLQRAGPYFPVLAAWARAGDDPAARVGFMVGALDDETRDELGAACEAEDFVPRTLAAMPAPFREPALVTWTTRFLQLVQEQLAPETEETGNE